MCTYDQCVLVRYCPNPWDQCVIDSPVEGAGSTRVGMVISQFMYKRVVLLCQIKVDFKCSNVNIIGNCQKQPI